MEEKKYKKIIPILDFIEEEETQNEIDDDVIDEKDIDKIKDHVKTLEKELKKLKYEIDDIYCKEIVTYQVQSIDALSSTMLSIALFFKSLPYLLSSPKNFILGSMMISNTVMAIKCVTHKTKKTSFIASDDFTYELKKAKKTIKLAKELIEDNLEKIKDLKEDLKEEFKGNPELEDILEKLDDTEYILKEKLDEIKKFEKEHKKQDDKNNQLVKKYNSIPTIEEKIN
jgi:septal ring factor EnvC (AmiA/AmiB activator)